MNKKQARKVSKQREDVANILGCRVHVSPAHEKTEKPNIESIKKLTGEK
jgi:hypothetical protein